MPLLELAGDGLCGRVHHRYSDEPGDPHSPLDGQWQAFLGWMYRLVDLTNLYKRMMCVVASSVLYCDQIAISYFWRKLCVRYWAKLPYQ